jgi:hypothetical protein
MRKDFFAGVYWSPEHCHPENLTRWLATQLRGMGEQPLQLGINIRSYRVTSSSTWGSRCSVRLETHGDGWRVTGRRRALPRNLLTDRPQEFVERVLDEAEAAAIEKTLARLALWSHPTLVTDDLVADGTDYLIELSDGGCYNAIYRHTPVEPEILNWCHLTHDLSGLGREPLPT